MRVLTPLNPTATCMCGSSPEPSVSPAGAQGVPGCGTGLCRPFFLLPGHLWGMWSYGAGSWAGALEIHHRLILSWTSRLRRRAWASGRPPPRPWGPCAPQPAAPRAPRQHTRSSVRKVSGHQGLKGPAASCPPSLAKTSTCDIRLHSFSFINGETEAQGSDTTCPKSHKKKRLTDPISLGSWTARPTL